MKKRMTIFALCCLLALNGCGGNKKPDDVSQEMYDCAIYAIRVVDLYLDGEATLEDTGEKLNSMNVPDNEPGTKDFSVEIRIEWLQRGILGLKYGTLSLSEFKQKREELAEKINYKD